jgi:uncharacterized membrane protein YvbJ
MNETKEFCPRCGTEVAADDVFCPNCGYNLAAYRDRLAAIANQEANSGQPQTDQAPVNNQQPNDYGQQVPPQAPVPPRQPAAPRKPMAKATKIKLWAATIIILILAGGYYAGSQYFSEANQLDRATIALAQGDAQTSAGYLTTDDPKLTVNKKTVTPLLKMFKATPSLVTQMKQQALQPAGTNVYPKAFAWVQSGRRLLLFPGYKFKFNAIYPRLTTNLASTKVKIGDRAAVSGKMSSKEVGPLVPGQYTITTTASVGGRTVKSSTTKTLTYNDLTLNLSFATVNFTADGYPGAEVQINGDNIGQIGKDGTLPVKNYPITGKTAKMTQVFTANGKKLTSRAVDIGDYGNGHIGVGYPGVISHDDADELLSEAFQKVHDLVRYDDPSDSAQKDAQALFEGGKDNQYYQQLFKQMDGFHKSKDIESWECKTRLEHVYPLAKNQAMVVFTVSWIFEHDTDDDSNRYHVQAFEYQGQIDKDPQATDENNAYVVKSFGSAKKTVDRQTDNSSDY